MTSVATYRRGKVVLLEFFWDHAEALETIGLADKGTPHENVQIVRRWLAAIPGNPGEMSVAVAEFWDAASGMDLEGDVYYCHWLRHGRFLRVEDHLTLRGALAALGLGGDSLEAAGLSQQDAHSDP